MLIKITFKKTTQQGDSMIPQYKGSYIPIKEDAGGIGAIGQFLTGLGNLSSESQARDKKVKQEDFDNQYKMQQQAMNQERNDTLNAYQNMVTEELVKTREEKDTTNAYIEALLTNNGNVDIAPPNMASAEFLNRVKTKVQDRQPTLQGGRLKLGSTDFFGNRSYDTIEQPKPRVSTVKNLNPYFDGTAWKQDVYTDGKLTDTKTVANPNARSNAGVKPKPFSLEEYKTKALLANPTLTEADLINSPEFKKGAQSAYQLSMYGADYTPPKVQVMDAFGNPILREQYGLKQVRTGRVDKDGRPIVRYEPNENMEKFNGTYKDMYTTVAKSLPDIADKLESKNFNSFVDKLEGQKYFNLLQDLTGNNEKLVKDIMTSEVRRASTRAGGFGSMLATTLGNISPFDWSDFDNKQEKIKNDTLSNMLIAGRLDIDKEAGINPRTGMYSFYLLDGKGKPVKNEEEMDNLLVEESEKVEGGSLGNVIGNPNTLDKKTYKNRVKHGVNRMSK